MWGSETNWPSASKEEAKGSTRQPGRQGGPPAAASSHAALSAPPGYTGPREGLDLSLDSIISQRIGVSLLAGQDTQPVEQFAQQRQQQHLQEQQRQQQQQQQQQQQWHSQDQQLQQQFQLQQAKPEPLAPQKQHGSPSASKVSWAPIRVSTEALPDGFRNSVPAGTQTLADRVPPGAHPLQWVLVVHALVVLRNLPAASFQACVYTIHTKAKAADPSSALVLLSSQLPSAEMVALPKSSEDLAHKFVEMFVKESTLVRNLTKTKYFKSLEANSNEATKLQERIRHLELEENMQASHIQGLEAEVAKMYTLEEEIARLKTQISETSSAATELDTAQQKRALTPEEEEEERKKREMADENEKAVAILVEQFAEAKKTIAAQEQAKSKEIAKARALKKQLEGVNAELEEASSLLEAQQKELTAASKSIKDAVSSEKAALERVGEQQRLLEEATVRFERDRVKLENNNASLVKDLAQVRVEHGSVTADIARLRRTALEEANKVEMLQKDVTQLVEERAILQRREQQLSATLHDSKQIIDELRQALANAVKQSDLRKNAAAVAEQASAREMEKTEALKKLQQEEYEKQRAAEEKNRRLQFEQSWERELEMRRAVERERLQQELEGWKKEEMHKIEQERLRILNADKEAREKIDAQERRQARERREAEDKREAQERRAARERREADEKREAEERRVVLEQRVAQEVRAAQEKREAQEQRKAREKGGQLQKEQEKVAEEKEALSKATVATPKNTTTVPRIYLNNLKKKLEAALQRSRFLEAQLVVDQGKIDELTRKVKALPASSSSEVPLEGGSTTPPKETVRAPELASDQETSPVKPRPISLFADQFRFTGSKRTSSVAMEEEAPAHVKRTRTQSLDREDTVEDSPSASQTKLPSSTPRRKLRRRKPIVTQKRTGMTPSQSSPVSSPAPKKMCSDLEMQEAKQKAEEAKERARREQLAKEEMTRARLLRAQEVRAKLQKAEERRRAMLKAKLTEKDALSVKKAHQRKAKWDQLRKFKEKKDGLLSALEDDRLAEESAAMIDGLAGASATAEGDSILALEGPTSPLVSPLDESDLVGALGSSVTDSGASPEAGLLLSLPMGSVTQSFLAEPLLQEPLPEAMVTVEGHSASPAGDTSSPINQPLKSSTSASPAEKATLEEESAPVEEAVSQESGDRPVGDKEATTEMSKAMEAEAEGGASSSVSGTSPQNSDTVMEEAGPTGSSPAPSGIQEDQEMAEAAPAQSDAPAQDDGADPEPAQPQEAPEPAQPQEAGPTGNTPTPSGAQEDQEMAEAAPAQSGAPVQSDGADPVPAQPQKKKKRKRKKKKRQSLTTGPVLFGPGGSTLGGSPAVKVVPEREEGEIVEEQAPRAQTTSTEPVKDPDASVPGAPAPKQLQGGKAEEREPGEVPEEREPGEIVEDREPGQVSVEMEPGEIKGGKNVDRLAQKKAAVSAHNEQVLGDESAEREDVGAETAENVEKSQADDEKAPQSEETEVQASAANTAPTELAALDKAAGAPEQADNAPPLHDLDLGEDLDSVVCFDTM